MKVETGHRPVLTVGVRALAEQTLREGDLVSGFSARPRPMDAIRAHQKIQDERPENYTAEVSVSHTIEEELFDLKIGGRIDGLFPASSENPPMVEEIKTTLMDPAHFSADPFPENPIHWGQGKIYAYLYVLANDLEEIGVQLTYAHLKTGEIRSFQKSFSIETLADFFHEVIGRYRRWAEIAVNWKIERDRSIRELAFPFSGYRPGQREMAVSVYRTIREGKQLMVGAPTGIGKTAAAIFPAVKALGEEHIDKLFFLAARTTGKGAAEKSAAHLEENGLRFRWLTMTAKARICFSVDGPCNAVSCPYAIGYYDRLDGGLSELLEMSRLTRQVIESVAEKHGLCPFELSLELVQWADGIICDYNYAFDPKAYLRRIFDEKGKYGLLIDEAHNLVDRSREMFSAEIDKVSVMAARRSLRGKRDALYRTLGKINSWMLQEKKGLDRKEKEGRNGNRFIADSPSPPLERELIQQHFEGEYGAGYAYAYQFPGINRVLQAAGRVIRTETDRGVVLLIDDRYFSFRYRNLLPKEWTPAAVLGPKDLKKALSQFWKSNGDGESSRNINFHHRTINGEDPCPAFKKSSSSR